MEFESDIGDHAVKVNKQVLIYQQKAKSKVFADCEEYNMQRLFGC